MTDRDWTAYYNAVAGKPPRETLVMALDNFEAADNSAPSRPVERLAFDMGCGEGRDTRELLRRHGPTRWRVLAADPTPGAAERTLASINPRDTGRLRAVTAALQDMPSVISGVVRDASMSIWVPASTARPEAFRADLVNASFVLPFVLPADFSKVWNWLRSVLAPGGRFAGQFFGPRDSWAELPGRSHHSREQVLAMLDGLTLEHFQEEEKDGHDAEGNAKHWHVFHVVAKRPA